MKGALRKFAESVLMLAALASAAAEAHSNNSDY